jgi:hypothetical protein
MHPLKHAKFLSKMDIISKREEWELKGTFGQNVTAF